MGLKHEQMYGHRMKTAYPIVLETISPSIFWKFRNKVQNSTATVVMQVANWKSSRVTGNTKTSKVNWKNFTLQTFRRINKKKKKRMDILWTILNHWNNYSWMIASRNVIPITSLLWCPTKRPYNIEDNVQWLVLIGIPLWYHYE